MTAELYLLEPGNYEMILSDITKNTKKTILQKTVKVNGPRTQINFILPPRETCELKIQPQ